MDVIYARSLSRHLVELRPLGAIVELVGLDAKAGARDALHGELARHVFGVDLLTGEGDLGAKFNKKISSRFDC